MKTIVSQVPESTLVCISDISAETISKKIVVLENRRDLALLTRNCGDRNEKENLFFTPLRFSNSGGGHYSGDIHASDNVNKFLKTFVSDTENSKVHIFDNYAELGKFLSSK
jgi:hypothetical protein